MNSEAEIVQDHLDDVVHFDPEFPEFGVGENYTFGDPGEIKRKSLRKLSKGDYVFFYGTLDYRGDRAPEQYWITSDWGGYVFGHFRLATDPIVGKDSYYDAPEDIKTALQNNAHLRRNELNEDIVFILGDPDSSRLYETAAPLSLPATTLTTTEKASHLFEMEGVDKKSAWHRGPIEFNKDITELLLNCYQHNRYLPLMGEPLIGYPGFADFDDELGSIEGFEHLHSFLESNELTEEEELLTSFLYITGGWSTDIPKAVFEAVDQPVESPALLVNNDDVSDALTRTFGSLRGTGWPHNHRTNIPREAGRHRPDKSKSLEPYITEVIVDAIKSLSNETETLTELINKLESSDTPFDDGMTRFKQISSFSRLAAFDFLETLVRVNDRKGLRPSQLKESYIDSSGPESGFEHVFGTGLGKTTEARQVRYLNQLVAYACEEYGMSVSDSIFAVESALCNCQKDRSHSELRDLGYASDEVTDVDSSDWNC